METCLSHSTFSLSDLVRRYFLAYEAKHRAVIEHLLADDFTFSSPNDENIDKSEYFEKCWPNDKNIRAFHIEKILEQRNEVFVVYTCQKKNGDLSRNTEFFRFRGTCIEHIDVYFGTATKKEKADRKIRAAMDEMTKAYCAKDANALTAHYAPDIVAFDPTESLSTTGIENVRRKTEEWFSGFSGNIVYDTHYLEIAAGDEIATCHSMNHFKGTTVEDQRVEMWMRATVCFGKCGGRWGVTHLHGSVPVRMEDKKALMSLSPREIVTGKARSHHIKKGMMHS